MTLRPAAGVEALRPRPGLVAHVDLDPADRAREARLATGRAAIHTPLGVYFHKENH